MAVEAGNDGVLPVLEDLARRVEHLRLPLHTDEQAEADAVRRGLADQLHDYVLPRLRRLDAPVLAVVGGPTGAGKATLMQILPGLAELTEGRITWDRSELKAFTRDSLRAQVVSIGVRPGGSLG